MPDALFLAAANAVVVVGLAVLARRAAARARRLTAHVLTGAELDDMWRIYGVERGGVMVGVDLARAGSDHTVIARYMSNVTADAHEFARFREEFSTAFAIPRANLLMPRPAPGAAKRSTDLLRDWLSPSQLEQLDRGGTFEVVGDHTGKRYRIMAPGPYNIRELDEAGRAVMHWCVEPRPESPLRPFAAGDIMLAQKIALETNEKRTLAIANFQLPGDRAIYHHAILRRMDSILTDGPTT